MDKGIGSIKGIGPKTEASLHKLNIFTVLDLLEYYPNSYDVYEPPVEVDEITEGQRIAVLGKIAGTIQLSGTPNMKIVSLYLKGKTTTLKVVWFRMGFLKNTLKTGQLIILRGVVKRKNNQLLLEQPEIFQNYAVYSKKLGTLQPRYTITKGISNNLIRKTIQEVLNESNLDLADSLPKSIINKYHLCSYQEAIYGMHFPESKEVFFEARSRIVFEEFICFIIALQAVKHERIEEINSYILPKSQKVIDVIKQLPYELTNAQKVVWSEIQADISNPHKLMCRLIQGDVGSGKTILALLALLETIFAGYQGAMMAPTEVLAKQHYISITKMFSDYNIDIQVVLLTGSMKLKEKRDNYQLISSGKAQLIIGTHALIQEKVNYSNLALVVTDEQHRFGVKQREQLANKGINPHILVMSATPIPRTLAIILYGDLDISIVNELPANRLPIKNCVVNTTYRSKAYEFMKQQVGEGRQCYIICPMVEESEHMDGENVIDYAKELQEILGNAIRVSYLHGKMKQSQKDEIMDAYYNREIDILVSTTVIEVGINVPNATVMLIENSERFGLSALHQLRGRVGRGIHQSYCIFMTSSKTKATKERLDILGKSNDGFQVASEDLRLRGPGDLFGIRQSGLMNFKIADIYQDSSLLQMASKAVSTLNNEEKQKILVNKEITTSVIL